jgi:hypothetical protein
MVVRYLKAAAIAACVAGGALMLTSQSANARSAALDSCSATCSAGSCSAQTSWYEFFSDCACNCGTDGRPKCGCD